MLVSLTVGKVDAGVAVLLTEDKRLIEFPSVLLPTNIQCGSIVDISVARNPALEKQKQKAFVRLQDTILHTYGLESPAVPVLRCRNATQTSIVLEWDALHLATAELRSLALYRNGAKAGVIPRVGRDGEPVHATKVSGLAIDTEYNFHLQLLTSAGAYTSATLTCRTQKMTDLTGITVTPGPLPSPLRASLATAVERIGAKLVEGVRIDTTHFICTEGRGREWEKAGEMNIPVVRPEWIEGCEREGRIVGVRGYYLGADPRLRQVGSGPGSGVAARNISQQSQTTASPSAPQSQSQSQATASTQSHGQEQHSVAATSKAAETEIPLRSKPSSDSPSRQQSDNPSTMTRPRETNTSYDKQQEQHNYHESFNDDHADSEKDANNAVLAHRDRSASNSSTVEIGRDQREVPDAHESEEDSALKTDGEAGTTHALADEARIRSSEDAPRTIDQDSEIAIDRQDTGAGDDGAQFRDDQKQESAQSDQDSDPGTFSEVQL